jgi:tryptophan synthase beta chain
MSKLNYQNYQQPDQKGFFGQFGGQYVPPELKQILTEIEQKYFEISEQQTFKDELNQLYRDYVGRPSPLYFAQNLTKQLGGAKIYLKREDLNHMGAHKINNTLGQALLAKAMGKTKLIAETGAGQHGVATATAAALLDLDCSIYMGERDVINQAMNVYRMKLLGAEVITVTQGQGTLKDAIDQALAAYMKQAQDSYYLIGSVVGPHPYPLMVRDFQSVIGQEVRSQAKEKFEKMPDYLIACIGGGSNAMGLFADFIDDKQIKLVGVEPAGKGANTQQHGLALQQGQPGILHGFKSKVLQHQDGSIRESYSAASGLDYPGVGPEPSLLAEIERLELVAIDDDQAVAAFTRLSEEEGIIPALESAHAVAYALDLAPKLSRDKTLVVNLSGRGDKDVKNVYENLL